MEPVFEVLEGKMLIVSPQSHSFVLNVDETITQVSREGGPEALGQMLRCRQV